MVDLIEKKCILLKIKTNFLALDSYIYSASLESFFNWNGTLGIRMTGTVRTRMGGRFIQ